MNILEIEDIIKGLPDQSLMQEAQAPSGQMPQFLVVSEIQRRADMRKRFQNQQQEMPQGTIAQQIVQGGIASMGNQQPIQPMPQQGMPPQGMPPMPPQGMPPAMQQQPPMSPPMSPPMMGQPPMQPQGMAAGGVVRMQPGGQLPYTGGTQIDPGYEEFMQKQKQDYLLSQGRIRESMPAPEPSIMDKLLQGGREFGPNYNLIAPSVDKYAPSMGERFGSFVSGLKDKDYNLPTQEILDALSRGMTPLGSGSLEDNSYSPTGLPPYKKLDTSSYDPITGDFLTPYLNSPLDFSVDAAGGNAVNVDANRYPEVSKNQSPDQISDALEPGLNTKDPEKTVQEDVSKDQDYSSLMAAIDQFKPVDYSAFKPDYLNLITEQERRAQKIRDDASKDASAQALIQLGAGLAAGDISKGLSAAGQSVADIKRQARAEARDEEGFARQLRLAQDEAGMQLGVKGAEAEREMARFKATYGVSLKELENTMTLARERIEAEANTEAGRALRGRLEGLNNLIKNLVSDPFAGDMEQNKAAIAQAVAEMKSLLGITGKKEDEKGDPDAIEKAKSLLGIQ